MSRPPNLPLKQKNKNKNNNNTQSTHLNTTNDHEDVVENLDDDSMNWTLVQSTKDGKRYHSSSSEQNSPQTPMNKNKKTLVRFLREEKAEFHTYQLKEDKPIRVVIRNLHPTTPLELIKSELEQRLFEVGQVSAVLHKVNKNPLPLFFVDLEPTSQSNDIFQLTSLLHTKIKVEEPYKLKVISQCTNCQVYGHTKSYCGYPARCVRCGDHHSSSDCPNSRDAPPKCALCSGDHPSNYKGCTIYKDLQRRKNPKSSNHLSNKFSYKNTNVQDTHTVKASTTHPSESTPTYAQATSNSHSNHTEPSPAPDINKIMSTFIDEFKQLINPLIALLTKSCAILMYLNNVPTTIAAIYSPPRHNMNFQNYVEYFTTLSHNCIMGGDYNAKHHSWGCRTNNPRGNVLHNFITQKGFKALAPPGPTYWPTSLRKKPDILDIFVSNTPSNIYYTTSNLLEPSSDHSAALLTVSAAPPIRSCPPKLFHSTTDKQKFHDLVNRNINLNISLKTTQEIDDAINNFTNVIQIAAWDASTSHRQHFNHSPSIPEYIRILISNKHRARALYQRYRLPSLKRNFNNLANSLKKILSSHKNQTQANYLTNLSSKDGSLWQATKKSLRHQAPNTPLINPFGGLTSTDAEKAELLKNHLAKIFTPHSDIQIPQHTALVNRFLDSPLPPTLPSKYFTPNDIKNAIQNYSLKKSPGYDLITAEVAKCLPKRAIVLLTILINASLRLAYFPQLWKFSIIIVFPKPKKPPDILSSYRPISLLPFFAKIFERLILKRILPYIFSNNIIPNTQFGFRASHATTHQLHRLVDTISFSFEKKKYCSCVFLDVSQAFDRVWHEGLLFKIKAFLPTTYFLLIKSYLTDRHFQVKFGSSFSNIEKISAGVPQGGILSPILYNVYAADQPTSPTTSVAEFADDRAIISVHEDPHIASLNLQNHLDLISVWYDKWRVKVNQSKSIHTTFTLRLPPCPEVFLNSIPIPSSQSVKYLGLIFDRRLTWGPHIKAKKLALNERLRLVKPLISNKHTKLNTKLLIYKSLIKPMWTYGLQLWGNAKVTNVNKIQTVQNKILRLITKAPPYVSNYSLHTDLNIKTVHAEAITYYKRFHNRLPYHPNPLISNLASRTIPGNPTRRLKRNWCRDLLNE
ncbi:hypothetical protein QTP88_027881 [Uroleucon formosanum]